MADEHDLGLLSRDSQPSDFVDDFIASRRSNLSPHTIVFYRRLLGRAGHRVYPSTSATELRSYLNGLPGSPANQHAHYRALRAYFRWLFSPRSGFGLIPYQNPMTYIEAPKLPRRILPSLQKDDVERLLQEAKATRDKAIVAFLAESGLRLSELTNMRLQDIDWDTRTVRVIGKGDKEGFAPFGRRSEQFLRDWLDEHRPAPSEPLWGLAPRGVQEMLAGLSEATGLPCNAHTFRRTFASLLRKAGVDTLTIKQLGRWESVEMVERYTRSVTFEDSMKLYRAPLEAIG